MRIATFALALTAVLALCGGATVAAPIELKRGVGVHQWLNWSPVGADGAYVWPPYRSVDEWLARDRPARDWPAGDEFTRIRELGFDFIRLTVDPGPLMASEGEKRAEALAILAYAVKRVTKSGLKVVFNLHAVDQVPAFSGDTTVEMPADSDRAALYLGILPDVARMLLPLGIDKVAFEPFNEPQHYPCEGRGDGEWQKFMTYARESIRKVSTELTIIVTGACGGDVDGLVDLDPSFDDPNLYYSFHMYEPHLFTHQRAQDPTAFASGLPWPASAGSPDLVIETLRAQMNAADLSEAEQLVQLGAVRGYIERYFRENWGEAQMQARLKQAVDWAEAHNIPTTRLFMGEFGVILMSPDGRSGAFDADRLRYLKALRLEAERYQIPWSVWEYSNPFGMTLILPTGPAVPDQKMLEALGLQ